MSHVRVWTSDPNALQDVHLRILRARGIYVDERWSEVAKALKVPVGKESFVEHKKFLSLKDLNKPYSGGLSSYSLVQMILALLRQEE